VSWCAAERHYLFFLLLAYYYGPVADFYVHTDDLSGCIKCDEYLEQLSDRL
jgi:hypothetical protein